MKTVEELKKLVDQWKAVESLSLIDYSTAKTLVTCDLAKHAMDRATEKVKFYSTLLLAAEEKADEARKLIPYAEAFNVEFDKVNSLFYDGGK